MGFVRESSKKTANPLESSANPPANPLDFSPQQLRFLVRAGPTLMRILSEYLRILWSSPHSNLVFWYKPEAPESERKTAFFSLPFRPPLWSQACSSSRLNSWTNMLISIVIHS